MLKYLKRKLSIRQTPQAEQQLAAIAGVGDFLTPLTFRESESYLPAVIACIDYISQQLATLPVKVCRRSGTRKEVVDDHPIADLLADPHPQYSGTAELILLATRDLLATGNAIIVVDQLDGRMVLEHIPFIYVTCPYREYNAGYRVTFPGNQSLALPASKVMHLRIGCDDGGFIGRSPLARNAMTVALSRQVEKATNSLWTNGVYPSVAIKTNKSFKDNQQREDARQSLIKQLGGDNRGKPMFLEQDFGIEQIAPNSKDLEHLDQRMLGIVQICMIFGLSPVIIGDLRFGTYTNFAEARKAGLAQLSIYQRLYGEVLTKKLLGDEKDLKITLDSSHLLQTRNEKVDEITKLVEKGIISPDDAKKELGYG